MKILSYSLLYCFSIVSAGCFGPKVPDNTQEVFDQALFDTGIKSVALLEAHDYPALLKHLESLNNEMMLSSEKELMLGFELKALELTRRDYSSELGTFVDTYRNHAMPWLLRSSHYLGKAWQKRGNKFSKELSEDSIKGMEYYRGLAVADIDMAIKLNEVSIFSHLVKAKIHIMDGSEAALAKASFNRAAEIMPHSYRVFSARIHYSTPRWGGSIETMLKLISDSKKFYDINPKLKRLRSKVKEEKGDQAWQAGDNDKALALYLEALKEGGTEGLHVDLAVLYFNKNYVGEACYHIGQAIKLSPVDWRAYRMGRYCR